VRHGGRLIHDIPTVQGTDRPHHGAGGAALHRQRRLARHLFRLGMFCVLTMPLLALAMRRPRAPTAVAGGRQRTVMRRRAAGRTGPSG
jgi:hypothetical protein